MTPKDHGNDTFLARWLEGSLSPEELQEFSTHADYAAYQKILAATEAISSIPYNQEEALSKVKKAKLKDKKLSVSKYWYWPVAAAIVLALVFTYVLKPYDKVYTSSHGEQLAVMLPDSSSVQLNAGTALMFDESNWADERVAVLEGEAFFKVKKGSEFKVKTALGYVTVLGTQFNTLIRDGLFEVSCYEGKVKVTLKDKPYFLEAGMALRLITDADGVTTWSFEDTVPKWTSGVSSFKSMPLKYVLDAIENQFDIHFVLDEEVDKSAIFTGSFPHTNFQLALKTVLPTMGLRYETQDGQTIKISQ